MKKWMCLLLVLLICIPVVYAENAFVLPEELTDIVEFGSAYDDYPVIKDTFLPKFLEAWNKLPESVQHLVLKRKTPIKLGLKSKNSGYDMISQDGNSYLAIKMGEYVAGESIEANFPTGYSSRDERKPTFKKIFFHEVGHFLDDINYNGTFKYSSGNAWRKLSKKERTAIAEYDNMSDQNSYSDRELFAEAFKIFILDPDYLQDNAQNAYQIIEKAIAEATKISEGR